MTMTVTMTKNVARGVFFHKEGGGRTIALILILGHHFHTGVAYLRACLCRNYFLRGAHFIEMLNRMKCGG